MNPFRPPAWIANRHLQSILPSLPLRRPAVEWRARAVIRGEPADSCSTAATARASWAWHAESAGRSGGGPPPPRGAAARLGGQRGLALPAVARATPPRARRIGDPPQPARSRRHARAEPRSCSIPAACPKSSAPSRARSRSIPAIGCSSPAIRSAVISACGSVPARAAAGIRIARIVAVCPVLEPATTLEALEHGPSDLPRLFPVQVAEVPAAQAGGLAGSLRFRRHDP